MKKKMKKIKREYAPMAFLKDEDVKQYLHFLFDRDTATDLDSRVRDKRIFLFLSLLSLGVAEKLGVSKKAALKLWKEVSGECDRMEKEGL